MDGKFQVVFSPEGLVEMLLLDGEVRKLTFDPAGSPFTADAVAEPEVRAALRQWMEDTNAEGWIAWRELAATLQGMGVDMDRVAARHPA